MLNMLIGLWLAAPIIAIALFIERSSRRGKRV